MSLITGVTWEIKVEKMCQIHQNELGLDLGLYKTQSHGRSISRE